MPDRITDIGAEKRGVDSVDLPLLIEKTGLPVNMPKKLRSAGRLTQRSFGKKVAGRLELTRTETVLQF